MKDAKYFCMRKGAMTAHYSLADVVCRAVAALPDWLRGECGKRKRSASVLRGICARGDLFHIGDCGVYAHELDDFARGMGEIAGGTWTCEYFIHDLFLRRVVGEHATRNTIVIADTREYGDSFESAYGYFVFRYFGVAGYDVVMRGAAGSKDLSKGAKFAVAVENGAFGSLSAADVIEESAAALKGVDAAKENEISRIANENYFDCICSAREDYENFAYDYDFTYFFCGEGKAAPCFLMEDEDGDMYVALLRTSMTGREWGVYKTNDAAGAMAFGVCYAWAYFGGAKAGPVTISSDADGASNIEDFVTEEVYASLLAKGIVAEE